MFIRKIITLLLLLICTEVYSESRPIKIMVPFSPGGPVGNLAQLLQKSLTDELKIPVVVEYKPGGGGSIGTAYAITQSSDPVLILNTSAAVLNTFKNPQAYSEKQLVPVAYLGKMPLILVSSKKSNLVSLQQLVNFKERRPLMYGSAGIGSVGHLAMEKLNLSLRQDLIHIPYRGTNPVLTDIISGNIDLGFVFVSPAVRAHIKNGDIVPLAVEHHTRLPGFSNVPTFREYGFGDAGNFSWFAVFEGGKWSNTQSKQIQKTIQQIFTDPVQAVPYKEFGLVWEVRELVPPNNFIEQQRHSVATLIKKITFD